MAARPVSDIDTVVGRSPQDRRSAARSAQGAGADVPGGVPPAPRRDAAGAPHGPPHVAHGAACRSPRWMRRPRPSTKHSRMWTPPSWPDSAEIQLHFALLQANARPRRRRASTSWPEKIEAGDGRGRLLVARRVAGRGGAADAWPAPHDAGSGRELHRRSAGPAAHRGARQLALLLGRSGGLRGRA